MLSEKAMTNRIAVFAYGHGVFGMDGSETSYASTSSACYRIWHKQPSL